MLSISELVRKKLYRLKHLLRANYYFYPQIYQCSYEVIVKNRSAASKKVRVTFPIPQTMHNQHIENVGVNEPGDIDEEKKYNNKYFVSSIELAANGERKITLSFRAKVTPIKQLSENLADILGDNTVSYNRFIQKVSLDGILLASLKSERSGSAPQKRVLQDDGINMVEKITAIYNHVVVHLSYGNQINGLYTAKDALELACVDCGGYVTLLASLLKNINVSCVPVFGFFANHTIAQNQKNSMHAWGYIPLQNNKIFPVDPTEDYLYQHGQSYVSGGFGWVGTDRIIFSQGCDFDILVDGKKETIDILQNALIIPSQNDVTIDTAFKTTKC